MKKKILIFSLGYYPKPVGGAEVALKEITDRLGTDDYEWHLIANQYDRNLPKEEQVGAITVHRIGLTKPGADVAECRKFPLHLNKLFYQFTAYWKAKQLHCEHKFDAVWGMMAHSTGVPAGLFKRKFPDVPYLLTLQEGDPLPYIEKKMRIFGPLFKAGFVRADMVQAISNYLAAWATRMGFAGEPVLVPNAVNTAHFTQQFSDDELREVRRGWGVSENDVLLVTTSRLVPKNAVDDVIKALPFLPAHVKFVVFGNGPDEVMLRELATKKGVAERVLFQGFIDHADMPKVLKACDIFIRPSRSEGMGNSFIEAMAAELPVIATQEGGIADFLFSAIRNPERPATGWAVDVSAPGQIAEAVKDILAHPQATAETVATAKALALKDYDWDHIANRMRKEVFGTLLKEPVLLAEQGE